MELIRNFKELNKNDAPIAGGKGASLGEMTQAGIPVPPGFVILSSAFDQFIKDADLVQEIDAVLDKVNHKEIHTVENASEQIQGLIKGVTMPESIAEEIKRQFKNLDTEYVAVRSSATAEDGQEHAWAGQLDSFLNTTEKDLLEKVQHCWASLFTPRAIFYRFEKSLYTTQISVAVVVQKMVNSEVSGIAFSVHPVTEDRNQLIIEAGFGLGEAVVSGQITPDNYVVEKEPRRIIDINVNTQARALYRVRGGGNEWRDISEPQASSQVLNEKQILELSNIIIGIENHYSFPCDIEWAYENGNFYVVQSRPITTLAQEGSEHEKDKLDISFNSDKDRIVDYLKSHRMDIQNAQGSFFACDLVFSSYIESEKIHGVKFTPILAYLEDGKNFFQIISDENIMNVARKIYKDYLIDEKTLDIKIDDHAEITKKIDTLWENHKKRKSITDQELFEFFRRMITMSRNWWLYGVIGEDKGRIIDEEIVPLFEKNHNIDKNKAFEIISTLSHSEEQAAFSMERKSFYEACSYVLSADGLKKVVLNNDVFAIKNDRHFMRSFEDYRRNYFYKNTDFSDRKEVTIETFIAELKVEIQENTSKKIKKEISSIENATQEIKENKQKILSSIIFTTEEKKLINFASKTVCWIDNRKVGMMKQFYYLFSLLHEIAEMCHVAYEDVAVLFVPEVEKLLINKGKLNAEDLKERKKNLMVVYEIGEKNKIFYGQDASDMFRLSKGISEDSKKLKGSVASRGDDKWVSGIVRIVIDPMKDPFEKDEILVTSMTRIEFVPLMKKAKMIVTDEGGIACHAAIVSRELGVPCIIGTKNATDILANGDVIKADTEKGFITITKKYGN